MLCGRAWKRVQAALGGSNSVVSRSWGGEGDYRAEGQKAGHSMFIVINVGQDVGGAPLAAQAVLLDELRNAAPALRFGFKL